MSQLNGFFNAFGFMFHAIANKRKELLISLIMVLILLVLASVSMYLVEHEAQPKAFSSIPATMWWAVATLTTVGYGDMAPITGMGQVLGGVIAILGVGLVALPAGIIASGFIEEIEKDKRLAVLKEHEEKLEYAFFVEYFHYVVEIKKELKIEHLPRKWLSINDIKYKIGMSEDMVIEVIGYSKLFRMMNVKGEKGQYVGLEYIERNNSYGRLLNKGSNLTVVNLFACIQPHYSHFSLVLADLLGANLITNEVYNQDSYLKASKLNLINHPDYQLAADSHPSVTELKRDLKSLLGTGKTCIFLVNSLKNEDLLQFNIGAEVGEIGFEKGVFFKDTEKLTHALDAAKEMAAKKEMKVLTHEKQGKPDPDHVSWYIHKETDCNLLLLHVNVGLLKGSVVKYYKDLAEIADCLKLLK